MHVVEEEFMGGRSPGPTGSLVREMPRQIGLWLLIILLSAGCRIWSNDTVRVKIVFTDPNPAHQLTNVTAIVADEKIWWAYIDGGETNTAILAPFSPSQDWQLTLFYDLDGKEKIWESPVFDDGKGYRIEIKIDAQGAVTHRSCFLPCSLAL
jgi:hypothetical protein